MPLGALSIGDSDSGGMTYGGGCGNVPSPIVPGSACVPVVVLPPPMDPALPAIPAAPAIAGTPAVPPAPAPPVSAAAPAVGSTAPPPTLAMPPPEAPAAPAALLGCPAAPGTTLGESGSEEHAANEA